MHGRAHGDAVGVLLVQPGRVEVPDERARAQKGGFVALAFLFGKRHHLDAKRQAAARAVQLAHTGHGHEDTQAPVVFAAVAHGVVMAARHEVACAGGRRVVAAHHVAHGVHLHRVKAAFAHPVADALCTGTVRVGEVGHGELALFGKAGVGVLGELFVPVPHVVAQQGLGTQLVVQADLGNAVDVAQGLGALEVCMVAQPPRKGVDDLLFAQPRAARPAHRQDEREAEARVVVGVELLNARKLVGRALREARLRLLVRRFGRQALRHHGLACQLGVGTDQAELRVGAGRAHGMGHGVLEVRQRAKRPLREGLLGNPGRMFIHTVQQLQRLGGAGGVQLFQGQGHGACFNKVSCLRLWDKRQRLI